MKRVWPFLVVLLCSFSSGKKSSSDNYDAARKYTVTELKEDLSYLREKYEHHNPNLYLYTPKQEMDKLFDSLAEHINIPMTDMEFYRYLGPIASRIKDTHTSVFPNEDCEWWYGNQHYFLPLMVTCNNDHIVTDLCASADHTVPDGSEILKINGRTSTEILNLMKPYAPRDGGNQSRVTWMLNNFFSYYYCYCVESPAYFDVEYKTPEGQVLTHRQYATTVDSMWYAAYNYYPQRYIPGRKDSAITLRFQDDSAIAILRIRTFDKGGLKAMGIPSFRAAIHHCFSVIASADVKNLIIDVRDNGGGNPEYARYLVAHLMDTSFVYIEKFETVDRLHWNDNEHRDHVRWYPYCGIGKFKPDHPAYNGRLYVLMDGGSTSTAGDFVACLAYYHRAIFIGEESGSNRVISGGSIFEDGTFFLPHTRLRCMMSTIRGVNKSNIANDGHGVIPDYLVVPAPADYMAHRNPMLEKALELIRQADKRCDAYK